MLAPDHATWDKPGRKQTPALSSRRASRRPRRRSCSRAETGTPPGRPCVEQLLPAASVRDRGRAPLGRRASRFGTNPATSWPDWLATPRRGSGQLSNVTPSGADGWRGRCRYRTPGRRPAAATDRVRRRQRRGLAKTSHVAVLNRERCSTLLIAAASGPGRCRCIRSCASSRRSMSGSKPGGSWPRTSTTRASLSGSLRCPDRGFGDRCVPALQAQPRSGVDP